MLFLRGGEYLDFEILDIIQCRLIRLLVDVYNAQDSY